jgi:carnitine O-acetyltransferase
MMLLLSFTLTQPTQKLEALRKACSSHVAFIGKASNGFGVDRHMLGLRLCIQKGEEAEIFKDPLFTRSQHWDLSTSGLFPGNTVAGTGFGAVVRVFLIVPPKKRKDIC